MSVNRTRGHFTTFACFGDSEWRPSSAFLDSPSCSAIPRHRCCPPMVFATLGEASPRSCRGGWRTPDRRRLWSPGCVATVIIFEPIDERKLAGIDRQNPRQRFARSFPSCPSIATGKLPWPRQSTAVRPLQSGAPLISDLLSAAHPERAISRRRTRPPIAVARRITKVMPGHRPDPVRRSEPTTCTSASQARRPTILIPAIAPPDPFAGGLDAPNADG
jgi:hypothetical protein